MAQKNKVSFSARVDSDLKEKAMFVIQNKLNLTIQKWIEMKFKEVIKEGVK